MTPISFVDGRMGWQIRLELTVKGYECACTALGMITSVSFRNWKKSKRVMFVDEETVKCEKFWTQELAAIHSTLQVSQHMRFFNLIFIYCIAYCIFYSITFTDNHSNMNPCTKWQKSKSIWFHLKLTHGGNLGVVVEAVNIYVKKNYTFINCSIIFVILAKCKCV